MAIAFQVNHDNMSVSGGSSSGQGAAAYCYSHTAELHFLSPSIVQVHTHTEYSHMWHTYFGLHEICYTLGPSVGEHL